MEIVEKRDHQAADLGKIQLLEELREYKCENNILSAGVRFLSDGVFPCYGFLGL